jgi:hypothetical protein
VRSYAFPIAVVVAAVLIALALGGVFKRSALQDVVLVPVSQEKGGYKVTVEQIVAKKLPERAEARLDLLLTIERLDGRPIEHDPYLAAEARMFKMAYRPTLTFVVTEHGLDMPQMGYAVPPLRMPNVTRKILSFQGVPQIWMAVDLNFLIAPEKPQPDFIFREIALRGSMDGLPRAKKGGTRVDVVSVRCDLLDTTEGKQPTTFVTIEERSPFITPGKGWSRIGLPLGDGRLVDKKGHEIGCRSFTDPMGSLGRARYGFYVFPESKALRNATLEFVSTEAMLKGAIGFRFEGMTTLAPG